VSSSYLASTKGSEKICFINLKGLEKRALSSGVSSLYFPVSQLYIFYFSASSKSDLFRSP
jgi:hypothetical protein